VIQVSPQTRILVAVEPVDFRKGIDGLARLAKERLRADPLSGCVFVFRRLLQPVDVLPAFGPAEFGQNRHQHDIKEEVTLAADFPRIRKGGEMERERSGIGPHGLESPWYVLPEIFMNYKCSYYEIPGILIFKQNHAYHLLFQ